MKALSFLILVVFVLFNCKTTQLVPIEKTKMDVEFKENKPELFLQEKLSGISPSDSVKLFKKALFYTSCEVTLRKALGNISFNVNDNGVVNKADSIKEKQKKVLPITPGHVLSVTPYANYLGIIMAINVTFSKNDANYEFIFFRTDDDPRFVLSGDAIITINGVPHNVIAETPEVCYLYFFLTTSQVVEKTVEQADGWSNSAGSIDENQKKVEVKGFHPSYTPTTKKK